MKYSVKLKSVKIFICNFKISSKKTFARTVNPHYLHLQEYISDRRSSYVSIVNNIWTFKIPFLRIFINERNYISLDNILIRKRNAKNFL